MSGHPRLVFMTPLFSRRLQLIEMHHWNKYRHSLTTRHSVSAPFYLKSKIKEGTI